MKKVHRWAVFFAAAMMLTSPINGSARPLKQDAKPAEAAALSKDAVVVLAEPSAVQDIVVITPTPKSEEQQDPVVVIHSNQK